jgi:hypothetical protein
VRSFDAQLPEHVADLHCVATIHLRVDRLVRGAFSSVIDRDDTDARDGSGERDASWCHRPDRLAEATRQVDATMTRAVLGIGRIEPARDAMIADRPGPRAISASRRRRTRHKGEERQGDDAGEQHAAIPRQ